MKFDKDVSLIKLEVPPFISKLCELFVVDLTERAWRVTQANNRKILQKEDIAAAVIDTPMFDFLVDIVPRDSSPTSHVFAQGMIPLQKSQRPSSSSSLQVLSMHMREPAPASSFGVFNMSESTS
jgi:hypothetical protein